MRRGIICLSVLVVSFAATGCSSVGEGEFARDFEVYYEDGELDTVTGEDEFGTSLDLGVERKRVGARFAFGGEDVRGFFQLFKEDWEFVNLPGGVPGAQYDNFGIGGGVKGAPKVGDVGDGVALLIPYRADLSLVGGEKSNLGSGESNIDMAYLDLHLDVGFGIDWKGLRPSAGLALSTVGGGISTPYGDIDLSGGNVGGFLDVVYKNPNFPLYGHLRFLGGDYQVTTIGIGAKF